MADDKMMPDEQEQAFRDAKAKAWLGDRDAQFSLGKMYCEGRGIPHDDPRSPEQPTHYHRPIKNPQGELRGQVYAAEAENFWEAYIWFDIADRNGHPEAAKYRDQEGHFVYQPDREAAKAEALHRHIDILKPAAWQGDADAQYKLSEAYREDPESECEYRIWLFVAASGGHKQAQEWAEHLERSYVDAPHQVQVELSQQMEMAKARHGQIKEEDIVMPHPEEAMKRRYAKMKRGSP